MSDTQTVVERIMNGSIKVGGRTNLWPNPDKLYWTCRNCHSKNAQKMEGELVQITKIDKVNMSMNYDIVNPKEACGCCGERAMDGTVYANGVPAHLTSNELCNGIVNPAKIVGTTVVNTQGGANIEGGLDHDGELVMRDSVVHNHYHI